MNEIDIYFKTLIETKKKYDSAISLLSVEANNAKTLFEEVLLSMLLLRRNRVILNVTKLMEHELLLEYDRIIRLCQDYIQEIINSESKQEMIENEMHKKFQMQRFLHDTNQKFIKNDDLQYYKHFNNKTLMECWHFHALSILLKPILFNMNVIDNNTLLIYGKKARGKHFFIKTIEKYTKMLFSNNIEWIFIDVLKFETYVREQFDPEKISCNLHYTYIVLNTIDTFEYENLCKMNITRTFIRMISNLNKCFFIILLNETKLITPLEMNTLTKYMIRFEPMKIHSLYNILKTKIIEHICYQCSINIPIEPFMDIESTIKNIPLIQLIKKGGITKDSFTHEIIYLYDFDLSYNELYYVAQEIYLRDQEISFDDIQTIFYNSINESNHLIMNTQHFFHGIIDNKNILIPVASFRYLFNQNIKSLNITSLIDIIDVSNEFNKVTFVFPKDIYMEMDSRFRIYSFIPNEISLNESKTLLTFQNIIKKQCNYQIIDVRIQLMKYYLFIYLLLLRQYKLFDGTDENISLRHIDNMILNILYSEKKFTEKNLLKSCHMNTRFFEYTDHLLSNVSIENNNNNFVLIIDYNNMKLHEIDKKSNISFHFQITVNEKSSVDLFPTGMQENFSEETFRNVLSILFNQNIQKVTKIIIPSGFRLYFQLNQSIQSFQYKIYKSDPLATCILLPLLPCSYNINLPHNYCSTNVMDNILLKKNNNIEENDYDYNNNDKELSSAQIYKLNNIYTNEQKFYISLLFLIRKNKEYSIDFTLEDEIYCLSCKLLKIPEEINNITLDHSENYFTRPKNDIFYINPIIMYRLHHYFTNEIKLFKCINNAYQLYTEIYENNCHDDSTIISWNIVSSNIDLEMISGNISFHSFSNILNVLINEINIFEDADFLNYLSKRTLNCIFFHIFANISEIYYSDPTHIEKKNRFIHLTHIKFKSNLQILISLFNDSSYYNKKMKHFNNKHRKIILSLILAEKYIQTLENKTIENVFLGFYLYFDTISASIKKPFFHSLIQDISETLHFIYCTLNNQETNEMIFFDIDSLQIDNKEYYISKKENVNKKNNQLTEENYQLITDYQLINDNILNDQISNDILNIVNNIKNTFINTTIILDQFFVHRISSSTFTPY